MIQKSPAKAGKENFDDSIISHETLLPYSQDMASLKQQIIEYLKKSGGKPVKPRRIARRLELPKVDRARFDGAIEALISRGKLQRTPEGRVFLPEHDNSARGLIAGVLRKTASGGAWLIPHREVSPGDAEDPQTHKLPDVFIYPEHLADAHNGDEVMVRLVNRRRSGGKRTGRVEQIIERATHNFVGTYFEEWNQGKVRIDGGMFSDPVSVGDPGAKGAQPGDKVVVEIVRFPTHARSGEAVITKILGARGEPGVDLLAIIHEYGLPEEFPEDVLAAARDQTQQFDESDTGDRLDLTKETIVTIDPVDARDFDDAISLKRTENGNWQLGVHIADVAQFVPEGSVLDQEAKKRGTSVYLPGRVIPMLPETISNGLASLQQGQVRFTKTVLIEFSPEGTPLNTEFHNSVIKVTRRFCYEEVMPIVQDPDSFKSKVAVGVRGLLCDMHELAMTLRRKRFENGSLELYLPEVKVDLDKDGVVVGAHEVVHDESHQIIEEFMLAANTAVATKFDDLGILFIRRVHGSPDPVKLKAFAQFVQSLGLSLDDFGSRFALQELLTEARDKPFEQAVNFSLLRSMKQAEYTGVPDGHYALAIDHYCHFTSPIRRYPDLTVHRLFNKVIQGKKKKIGLSEIETIKLSTHCSTTERRAAQAERDLTRVKLLMFLATKREETFSAVITGVEKFGIFCRCAKYPVDGFVHVTMLARGEYLDYDRGSYTLTARSSGRVYRMGDRVNVRVAVIDPDERTLQWELIEEPRQQRRRKSSRSRRSKPAARKPRAAKKSSAPVSKRKRRKRR